MCETIHLSPEAEAYFVDAISPERTTRFDPEEKETLTFLVHEDRKLQKYIAQYIELNLKRPASEEPLDNSVEARLNALIESGTRYYYYEPKDKNKRPGLKQVDISPTDKNIIEEHMVDHTSTAGIGKKQYVEEEGSYSDIYFGNDPLSENDIITVAPDSIQQSITQRSQITRVENKLDACDLQKMFIVLKKVGNSRREKLQLMEQQKVLKKVPHVTSTEKSHSVGGTYHTASSQASFTHQEDYYQVSEVYLSTFDEDPTTKKEFREKLESMLINMHVYSPEKIGIANLHKCGLALEYGSIDELLLPAYNEDMQSKVREVEDILSSFGEMLSTAIPYLQGDNATDRRMQCTDPRANGAIIQYANQDTYVDKKHSKNVKRASIFSDPYTLRRSQEYTIDNIHERSDEIVKARTYIQHMEKNIQQGILPGEQEIQAVVDIIGGSQDHTLVSALKDYLGLIPTDNNPSISAKRAGAASTRLEKKLNARDNMTSAITEQTHELDRQFFKEKLDRDFTRKEIYEIIRHGSHEQDERITRLIQHLETQRETTYSAPFSQFLHEMKVVYEQENISQDIRMQQLKELIYMHSLIYYSYEAEHEYKLAFETNTTEALQIFQKTHASVTKKVEVYSTTYPDTKIFYTDLVTLENAIQERNEDVTAREQRNIIEKHLHTLRTRHLPFTKTS